MRWNEKMQVHVRRRAMGTKAGGTQTALSCSSMHERSLTSYVLTG